MAYLNQFSRITIGDLVFKNISGFKIEESVTDISDKATITLPRHYKQLDGKNVTDYIKAGDRVEIKAGYDGELHTEYKGFVSHAPTADIPLVIECDELFPLRTGKIVKSYRNVTLVRLLREHINGFTIESPGVELGKVFLDHVSPYQMLEDLRKNFGFYSKVFNGNILTVGWAYDFEPGYTNHYRYNFGGKEANVKSAAGLKFKHKEDFDTKVKVVVIMPDGSKKEVDYGSKNKDAATNKITVAGLSEADAQSVAQARYTKQSWDGFEGSVKGWGYPRVHAGDSIEFTSVKYPERNGRYLAEKVTITYDDSGYERETKIGYRL